MQFKFCALISGEIFREIFAPISKSNGYVVDHVLALLLFEELTRNSEFVRKFYLIHFMRKIVRIDAFIIFVCLC